MHVPASLETAGVHHVESWMLVVGAREQHDEKRSPPRGYRLAGTPTRRRPTRDRHDRPILQPPQSAKPNRLGAPIEARGGDPTPVPGTAERLARDHGNTLTELRWGHEPKVGSRRARTRPPRLGLPHIGHSFHSKRPSAPAARLLPTRRCNKAPKTADCAARQGSGLSANAQRDRRRGNDDPPLAARESRGFVVDLLQMQEGRNRTHSPDSRTAEANEAP